MKAEKINTNKVYDVWMPPTLAKAPQIYTYDDVHAMVAEAW